MPLQTSPSEQLRSPWWQRWSTHVSAVHAFWSSQSVSWLQQPGTAMWVQPLSGSHPSAVHTTWSSQSSRTPARQSPPAEAGSQTSVPLQTSVSAQLFASPVHVPPLQASFRVHGFPSSHGPLFGVLTHCPPLQVSSVHGFLSLQ